MPRRGVGSVTVTFDDVQRAAALLEGVAHRTPVLSSRSLDDLCGAEVHLKAEHLQRTGSFKFRGAYTAVSGLSPEVRRAGVVTHSSGNHAQALALAARLCDTTAVVVMPHDAPVSKVVAAEAYGARVVRYDRYLESREEISAAIAEAEGRTLIPPYDHPDVIAGQGTATAELLTQVVGLDAVVVPTGGGGLLAGACLAATALAPGLAVYGVEPDAGDDHRRSRVAGHRVTIDVPQTIADGQQTTEPGELTWAITDPVVTEFLSVGDDQIVDAMAFAIERIKQVVEPSGAIALAAVLDGDVDLRGQRVGILLSGGNVSLSRLAALLGDRPR